MCRSSRARVGAAAAGTVRVANPRLGRRAAIKATAAAASSSAASAATPAAAAIAVCVRNCRGVALLPAASPATAFVHAADGS